MAEPTRKTPPWKVLVFPGGTEAGLEINRALRDCKEVELHSAGQAVPSAAEFRFRSHHTIAPVSAAHWLAELKALVGKLGIDFIYPAYDDVIVALASNAAEIPAGILGSPVATCLTTRSKLQTYAALRGVVAIPEVYAGAVPGYPVFVKPDRGQGSQGAQRVDDGQALSRILAATPGLIVTEYLPGEEFTIDCFSDRKRRLVFARGRSRVRTRSGISMQSRLVDNAEFQVVADKINGALDLRGAWFFQLKHALDGSLKLMEVGPRIAGTMALNRICGANFPLLTLYDAAGYDVEVDAFAGEVEISRSLDNHYRLDFDYDTVYVDLDDTLIVRSKVNTNLVKFLYQCINKGKSLHLVTRHKTDVAETLRRHRLQSLFDSVVHLQQLELKSAHLGTRKAIFIDDSFAERRDVASKLGIRTFDVSSVEALIDDRA